MPVIRKHEEIGVCSLTVNRELKRRISILIVDWGTRTLTDCDKIGSAVYYFIVCSCCEVLLILDPC